MPSRDRLLRYAGRLLHSSGNAWPRSGMVDLASFAAVSRFADIERISAATVQKSEPSTPGRFGRETIEHRRLKAIAIYLITCAYGEAPEVEMEWGNGRVDVGWPARKVAFECGDTSVSRALDILLSGWELALLPYPHGPVESWTGAKIYWYRPNSFGHPALIDTLEKIREIETASMQRCAEILDFTKPRVAPLR